VHVAGAVNEQTQALAGLAMEGDNVRRIAKQSARALGEQTQVLSSLNSTTQRHTSAMERAVKAITEQAVGSNQLGAAVTDIRERARELVASVSEQEKTDRGQHLEELALEIQRLRATHLAQAERLADLAAELLRPENGAASEPALPDTPALRKAPVSLEQT
jgi:methyl-accepting chemotaxis protein